ncbi:MAG: hypothetical protein HKN44_05730 [Ilumatobacter sp.]|nr:hypothetical protein [Ilumatobacter sp.]
MPRTLDDLRSTQSTTTPATRGIRLTRQTGRSFAAAVSVLLIATLVVNRSSTALKGDPASGASALQAGTIELTDDDEGRSLFDLSDLSPARPVEQCVEVTYGGTILPVALELRVTSGGELDEFLDIEIDEGTGGGFGSCEDFSAERSVFSGTVDELSAEGWIDLGDLVNTGESKDFRITLNVQDRQEALGRSANLEFGWEVTPS